MVVHRAKLIKHSGRELQLPSMSQLTNKNASQQFLLRMLKVVIQLREAARQARRKPKASAGQCASQHLKFESRVSSTVYKQEAPTTVAHRPAAGLFT